MDITPLIKGDRKVIHSYGAGRFIIGGQEYTHSVLLLPDAISAWSVAKPFSWSAELAASLIAASAAASAEILLIGTGETILPLPSLLRQQFRAKGLQLDVMDTGAACRTYNVLLSEERKVMAALLLV